VLDHGKVVEFGTPWELLQDESGVFRDLCRQSGEETQLVEVSHGPVPQQNYGRADKGVSVWSGKVDLGGCPLTRRSWQRAFTRRRQAAYGTRDWRRRSLYCLSYHQCHTLHASLGMSRPRGIEYR
jgi:hypothetical protein